MQTADYNSKVTSQAFQLTLVLHIFKLALYFNLIIVSNQIKYYLVINRGNFLQIRYGFYKHTFQTQLHYQLYVWWLVIGRACTKNSRKLMPGMWLFGASWWKVNKALLLYEVVHVSLFFLTVGAEIVNANGSDKDWHLTRWTKYTGAESCHL